tara:strand:- start:961 stop:1140 length:180 start_codon:yes stop_codon:yes gene_type:complete
VSSKNKPDGIELALFACLRYEEAVLKVVDTKARWNIDEKELETVLKYITNRKKEIESKL